MAQAAENVDEGQLTRVESIIINSMTNKECRDPDLLNGRRRKRIADGSGTTVQEVNNSSASTPKCPNVQNHGQRRRPQSPAKNDEPDAGKTEIR